MPAGLTVRTVGVDAQTAFPVGPARLRNGYAHGMAITFPAGRELRRADRCWVNFDRLYCVMTNLTHIIEYN